jgi:hypothetical protein
MSALSAVFREIEFQSPPAPPPPYQAQGPDVFGVVEGWEEVPSSSHMTPVMRRAFEDNEEEEEDIPTAEHVEYAPGFPMPGQIGDQRRLWEEEDRELLAVEPTDYSGAVSAHLAAAGWVRRLGWDNDGEVEDADARGEDDMFELEKEFLCSVL